MGVSMALPLLDAMVPARTLWAKTAQSSPTRFAAVEMVHGSAGATKVGLAKNLWSPVEAGSAFDLTPTSLLPLDPLREHLTIISNTDVRNAEAFTAPETGGDHFRSSATFLTQEHPKQTEGSDIHVGTSMDQLYAQRFGQDTPIPSMQLCIENVDQSGGCAYGYACVYTASRRRTDSSILDWITDEVARLKLTLGPTDRNRLNDYLDDVREIERRIQKIELQNTSGEPRELPEAPVGVPDSFREHVEVMFDLQALAFMSDLTRAFSFKMGRDASGRIYPESGTSRGFHPASHHGEREDRVLEFATINTYHVSLIPYFLNKLKNTPDGDGTLLDRTMLLYGSPMGNSNVHNHKRCPLFLAGHANGQLKGNLHVITKDRTPMANVMLTLLHKLGLDDLESFGDSTGTLAI